MKSTASVNMLLFDAMLCLLALLASLTQNKLCGSGSASLRIVILRMQHSAMFATTANYLLGVDNTLEKLK
jgi:hypothetical protein